MYVTSKAVSRSVHTGAVVEFTSGDAGDYYSARAVADAILLGIPGSPSVDDC
jgi:hypothetical protein